jgi:hypothetical protein
MAKDRLVGNDGALYLIEEATAFVGDAIKTLDELAGGTAASGDGKGFYQVTAIADASSVFNWDNPEVKDYFYNDGTLVLATGDKVAPVCLLNKTAEDTSVKSFDITLTKDKIDVTTLSDKVKTYRMGKVDASGTMTGITTVTNHLIKKRFLDILEVSSTGAFTMIRKSNQPLFFLGYLNDEEIANDTLLAVVGKIEIESGSLGATDGSAQEFSSGFAPSSADKLQVITIAVPAS